ncbi:MAG: hypothetical protein ACTSO9_10415 [Candidatus Helarchaeota archaeon]
MIKGIFVIYDSGICLYNKSIPNITPNDQLIAGFISALDRFCKTSIGENISFICTESLKFHFLHKNELIYVFISDKNDTINSLLPSFKQLIEKFQSEFTRQRHTFENQGLIPDLKAFDASFSKICF